MTKTIEQRINETFKDEKLVDEWLKQSAEQAKDAQIDRQLAELDKQFQEQKNAYMEQRRALLKQKSQPEKPDTPVTRRP